MHRYAIVDREYALREGNLNFTIEQGDSRRFSAIWLTVSMPMMMKRFRMFIFQIRHR